MYYVVGLLLYYVDAWRMVVHGERKGVHSKILPIILLFLLLFRKLYFSTAEFILYFCISLFKHVAAKQKGKETVCVRLRETEKQRHGERERNGTKKGAE